MTGGAAAQDVLLGVDNSAVQIAQKGARREKSHPHSDCFAVAGRLAVRVLPGRWPQPDSLQPNHQAVQLTGQLNLA